MKAQRMKENAVWNAICEEIFEQSSPPDEALQSATNFNDAANLIHQILESDAATEEFLEQLFKALENAEHNDAAAILSLVRKQAENITTRPK